MSPLEVILRHCAAAAPGPWYPREFAKTANLPWNDLADLLEILWLEGLVQRVRGEQGRGPALALSPEGEQVLADPAALERLRQGQSPAPSGRAATVRRSLVRPARSIFTPLLVLANVLVFAYGLYLIWPDKLAAKGFLQGPPLGMGKIQAVGAWNNPRVAAALEKSGLLTTVDLIHGQWWRLLSAAFVHLGLLHLIMNMVGLWAVGRLVEQTWGWWRFLLIYFLSALGGCVAAAAYQPQVGMGGASGALCGLVAAFGVWLVLNGKFLPRSLVGRWRVSLIITIGLTVFLSMLPGVSGWGHLGGAVAGGVAALLLQIQRFARPLVLRGLALIGVLVLPTAGHFVIERARATNPEWHKIEEADFLHNYEPVIRKEAAAARALYHARVNPLLIRHPARRNEADVQAALRELENGRQELLDLVAYLNKAGPYRDEAVAEALQIAREFMAEQTELLAVYERCLRDGERWTEKDETVLVAQQRKVNKLRQQWNELWVR